MAENKTKPTAARVEEYLAAIEDPERLADCRRLAKLMQKITKQPPCMWGPGIVGFGTYHYRYESGREGDSCLTGFASRKGDLSIYLTCRSAKIDTLLAQLGKHKMGKACLYVRRLTDIDLSVLEEIIKLSVAQIKTMYG